MSLLKRIAEKDRTAIKDCVKTYGDFIWTMARKFTTSQEEAEKATLEIFDDIWRYAGENSKPPFSEKELIARIAWRRLIRYIQVEELK